MAERIFGSIAGIEVGAMFKDRAALAAAGIHRPTVAGISGGASEGADSVVLSGGYEDDEDLGDEIIYTGHGGQENGIQVRDQELTRQNLALAISAQQGFPVRVARGAGHESKFSPPRGYQYAGLYRVDKYWHAQGLSTHKVWRFRLVRSDSQPVDPSRLTGKGTRRPGRASTTVTRVIRDTALSKDLKKLYDYSCQVCGLRLDGPAGGYAEAAHIRPLGRPHNGPDTFDNLLSLCPNHHYLFDVGAFGIDDNLRLIGGEEGVLVTHPKHSLDPENVKYHREHFGNLI